jgi:hypothetical protein
MKERFSIASNLTSKIFYIFVVLVIFVAIISMVHTATSVIPPINPGHSSTQIFIPIENGLYITLQTAISSGYLLGQNFTDLSSNYTTLPPTTPYEFASQILLTFQGQSMTLQEAINSGAFANAAPKAGYSYTTVLPAGGDYASNVNINTSQGVITLQNAINTSIGLLSTACIPGFVCPQGQGIGSVCYPSGAQSVCVINGTISSNGTCVGSSILPTGSICGGGPYGSPTYGAETCDQAGQCLGWSGSGCGDSSAIGSTGGDQCPNGVSTDPTGSYYCCNSIPSEDVSTLEYCGYSYSCSCGTSRSCTCTTPYSWSMVPAAGSSSGSCLTPSSSNTGSPSGGHGGAGATATSPGDNSNPGNSNSGENGGSVSDSVGVPDGDA